VNGGLVGLVIAFAAGLLSCLSPCVLPLVPIYVSHLGTTAVDRGADGRASEAELADRRIDHSLPADFFEQALAGL